MTDQDPPLDPILQPLLERGRAIQPVPDVVRARALARARAALAAAVVSSSEPMPSKWRRALPIAVAATVALTVGAAGAIAALRGRAPQRPEREPAEHPTMAPPALAPTLAPPSSAPVVAAPYDSPVRPQRTAHSLSPQESYAAELELLSRAQAAYADRNFATALLLTAEHARRFPSGRLAEEREALRIRSLASSGRSEEAAHAATSFANRFPRSVLLPRLSRDPR